MADTVIEKARLDIDDLLGNLVQRCLALANRRNQPLSVIEFFLQVLLQFGILA